jgi:hypothetical protein
MRPSGPPPGAHMGDGGEAGEWSGRRDDLDREETFV